MTLDGFPHHAALRDGSALILSAFTADDAEELKALYRSMSEEDRLALKDDVTSEEWARRFVDRAKAGELISVVARLADGKLVGEGTLYRAAFGWTRHVGELRVNVAASERRQGVASALVTELVRVASSLGVEKVITLMVENQVAAQRAFEKHGFRREATLPGHVKTLRGAKRDLQVWSNDIAHAWTLMEDMTSDVGPDLGD